MLGVGTGGRVMEHADYKYIIGFQDYRLFLSILSIFLQSLSYGAGGLHNGVIEHADYEYNISF